MHDDDEDILLTLVVVEHGHHMDEGFEHKDGIGVDKAKSFTTASITATVFGLDSHVDDRKL